MAIDLECSDGASLRLSGALDQNGKGLHVNQGHGGAIPLNAWSLIRCNLGSTSLLGKSVVRMTAHFNRTGVWGTFRTWIDDVSFGDGGGGSSLAQRPGNYGVPWQPSPTLLGLVLP